MPPDPRDPVRSDSWSAAAEAPALHRIRWIWAVYAALFSLSVPWYVPADDAPRIWLGLPHWVVLSLLAILAVALFTVFVIRRYWPATEPDAGRSGTAGLRG